ncbi:MAG: hypothetical protein QXW97_03330 [Candidatus Pacearchaeota archaeon]
MMTIKFQPIFERQLLCDICSIAITNPICPSCLSEEFEAWLTLYPNLKKELIPKLEKYINWLEDRRYNNPTTCIKCRKESVTICPYCFTEYVLGELKKLEVNKIILKEFFEFFNFDFERTGYTKEAEKLGFY